MPQGNQENCVGCGNRLVEGKPDACNACRRKYLPTLIKSAVDHGDYHVKLSGIAGSERFTYSTIHGEYVTLHGPDIDVRADLIATCGETNRR